MVPVDRRQLTGESALPRQCIAQKQHFMRPRSTKPFFATGEVVLKPT